MSKEGRKSFRQSPLLPDRRGADWSPAPCSGVEGAASCARPCSLQTKALTGAGATTAITFTLGAAAGHTQADGRVLEGRQSELRKPCVAPGLVRAGQSGAS